MVWPLPSSLATTKGIEFSFFSSRYLDVSLPGVPSYETMNSFHGASLFVWRVSPFGYPRLSARFRLPSAFRRLLRPSSAVGARASTLCSSLLDLASFPSAFASRAIFPYDFVDNHMRYPFLRCSRFRSQLRSAFAFAFLFEFLCSFQGAVKCLFGASKRYSEQTLT